MAILEADWIDSNSTGLGDHWDIYGGSGVRDIEYSIQTATGGEHSNFNERFQRVSYAAVGASVGNPTGIISNNLMIAEMNSKADIEFAYRSTKPLKIGRWDGTSVIGLDGGNTVFEVPLSANSRYVTPAQYPELTAIGDSKPFRGLVFYFDNCTVTDWFELDRISFRIREVDGVVDVFDEGDTPPQPPEE